MSLAFEAALAVTLQERRAADLYRVRQTYYSACAPVVATAARDTVQFCSNDYLGLANAVPVKRAVQQAVEEFGVGSGASHLVSGHHVLHHELENALADFTGRARALLLSTGFAANTGILQALMGKPDAVFQDRLNHASLIDGGLHCGAQCIRYQHNDVSSLERQLQRVTARRKLVVSDAVFSMDGDIAPIDDLVACAQRHNASVMLDDAHGFGVLNQGRGASIYDQDAVPIYMATLGKAMGSFGAFVAGSDVLIESLIQAMRPYIYSTALPPMVAAAGLAALETLQREPQRVAQLHELIAYFKQQMAQEGFELLPSNTAIQPLVVGAADTALQWSAALAEQGFIVPAIRPPTVPVGTARLRFTLSASHTKVQIKQLLVALLQVRQQLSEVVI